MTNDSSGKQLIGELLTDPVSFDKQGKAYQLLQHYFHGLPLETLRPLLTHSSGLVRGSAVFVASELGDKARSLVHEVVPLIHDADPHIQWDALEIVAVCSTGADMNQFVFVIRELENDDDSMRRLAMRLVSNASLPTIEVTSRMCSTLGSSGALHERGLLVLLQGESVDRSDLRRMLDSSAPLTRKYGAIAAKRLFEKSTRLLKDAGLNPDPDVSRFSLEALQMFASLEGGSKGTA